MNQKPIRISRAAAKRLKADMTGKTIVITGATAGIGNKTARSLAKMGGNIYFATSNREKTLDTIEEIRGKYFYYGLFRKGIYEKPGTDLVNDEALQERLWEISEELVGEEFHVG